MASRARTDSRTDARTDSRTDSKTGSPDPRKEPPAGRKRAVVRKELWSVVRQLTPAEGLALVGLTSWVDRESGVAWASDRQVCSQTGVSRDVMKRLRRKLAALGIAVTPGNNLSHDSCSYDLGEFLDAGGGWPPRPLLQQAEGVAEPGDAEPLAEPIAEPVAVDAVATGTGGAEAPVPEAPSLGAESTEGQGAERAQPWAQEYPPVDLDPYAYFSVTSQRSPTGAPAAERHGLEAAARSGSTVPSRDQGATPDWDLTSLPPTAPVWDLSYTGDLASQPLRFWGDELKREAEARRSQHAGSPEAPSPPPLPPYEQWLARR